MKVRFMWVAVQGVSSYIVTNKLLAPSRGVAHARGRALVLPVMDTSERKPFLASGDQLFPQLVRACVVFDGICVHRVLAVRSISVSAQFIPLGFF